MKVVEVPFCFYPEAVGGTEVYVESLARHLQRWDVEVLVAAPATDPSNLIYSYEGLPVRRFLVSEQGSDLLREIYGEGDPEAGQAFGRILDEEKPELVHLHAFTRAVSLWLVREAKKRDIPVIFTYHTPTVSCQRGTLMRWGSEACDGVLRLHTCARCTLHGLGLSVGGAQVVGSLPRSVGHLIGAAGLSGGLWTALRMTDLIALRHGAFRSMMAEVDHVVAVCEWVRDVLVRNRVPSEKITVSRQGLSHDQDTESHNPRSVVSNAHGPVRVAFAGRLDPTKGPHLLVSAVRSAPDLALELHLYGIVQGEAGASYLERLKATSNGDPRIVFHSTVPAKQVVAVLKQHHVLAVPSQVLETGPMVVLDAFAAGIPVLGSNLGGIAELVQHNIDGLLVEPNSVEAWSQTLRQLCGDKELLKRLQARVQPPRRMETVAREMEALYHSVLAGTRLSAAIKAASANS